jgi:hypothetical protein
MHSELCRAHCQAGDKNWEDGVHLLDGIYRRIRIDFLPRERGNNCAHDPRIRPILSREAKYTDEFRQLVALSGYTDPIAIILKFRRGLQPSTQDKIAESGTDQPKDNDLQGWFQAAHRFDLNRLANEAFRYTSRRPALVTTTTYPAQPAFSFL